MSLSVMTHDDSRLGSECAAIGIRDSFFDNASAISRRHDTCIRWRAFLVIAATSNHSDDNADYDGCFHEWRIA